jgi:thiamine monophosphate kinase
LVFTAPPEYTKNIKTLSKKMGLKISKIGSIVEGKTIRIIDKIGHDLPLETEGYQHF